MCLIWQVIVTHQGLCLQQAGVLREQTGLSVRAYVGDMNVDFWSVRCCHCCNSEYGTRCQQSQCLWLWQADMWRQEIQKHDVLVLTYQILLNTLSAGFIQAGPVLQPATAAHVTKRLCKLGQTMTKLLGKACRPDQASKRMCLQMGEITLLILDECHHCKKRHPANLVMQQFWHPAAPGARPRIFGMTASPVDTKKGSNSSLQNLFAELEANLGARVAMGGPLAAFCCVKRQRNSWAELAVSRQAVPGWQADGQCVHCCVGV